LGSQTTISVMASIENKAGSSTKRLSLIAALLLVLSLIVLGFYSSKNKTASQTAGEQVAEPRRPSAYQLPEPDIDEEDPLQATSASQAKDDRES